jgi:hypothetical protein
MELISVILSTFTTLMFVLGCLPVSIPAKAMPVATSALAYGLWTAYGHDPQLVGAVAAAGGVAIVSRYAVTQLPPPWSWDDFLARVIETQIEVTRRLRSRQVRVRRPIRGPVGNRIPKL